MSLRAGENLIKAAKEARLSMEDYLRLAVDPDEGLFKGAGMDGFECALAYLDLPVRNDFGQGISSMPRPRPSTPTPARARCSRRSSTYPPSGSIVRTRSRTSPRWSLRTRTVNGIEVITTVVDDKADDYQQTGVIAEGAEALTCSLRTSEKNVKFYKFGGGIEFTYEFERRASLDLITPCSRMQREVEIGQPPWRPRCAINGDGVSGAAPVVNATDLAATFPADGAPVPKTGRINWEVLLKCIEATGEFS